MDAEREYLEAMRRRIARNRVPYTGTIELTHRCNLRCMHCYCGDQDAVREFRDDELSTDQWLGFLDRMAGAGCLDLLISGGEPMLRADFPEIFSRAKELGMIVTVFCNGTMVGERIIELFSDLPPFLVEISLYGATAATHDRITQSPGSYGRMRSGVDRLLAAGIRVGLKTVLMTLNAEEYAQMEKLADELGAGWRSDAALFPCLPSEDSGGHANACGSCSGAGSILDFRVDAGRAAEIECGRAERVEALRRALERGGHPRTRALYTCGAGLTGFHMDPYGNLQPCLMATGYRENAVELGFDEAWRRLAHIRKVEAPQDYECNHCDLQPVCSGCPALFDLENGDPAARSEYICSLARHRFDKIREQEPIAGVVSK